MVGKRTQVKHINRYDHLFNKPECYTYHNYGHKAADCRLRNYELDLNLSLKMSRFGRRKKMKSVDQCCQLKDKRTFGILTVDAPNI
jgi:hypothetical protein